MESCTQLRSSVDAMGITNPPFLGKFNYSSISSSSNGVFERQSNHKKHFLQKKNSGRSCSDPGKNGLTLFMEKLRPDPKRRSSTQPCDPTSNTATRLPSDPCKSNFTLFLDKLKTDTKWYGEMLSRTPSCDYTSPLIANTRNSFSDRIKRSPVKEFMSSPDATWWQTYVKPSKVITPPKSHISQHVKFSSNGLPSQTFSFTPLMYRRAVSLRGHSTKKKADTDHGGSRDVSTTLRRSSSEKCTRSRSTGRNKESSTSVCRVPSTCSAAGSDIGTRLRNYQEDSPTLCGIRKLKYPFRDTEECAPSEGTAASPSSRDCSGNPELVKTNSGFHRAALASDINFLLSDLNAYLTDLECTLDLYENMKIFSPQKIRQRFDMPLQELENIYKLQCDVNDRIQLSCGKLSEIAKVFLDEKFISYQEYLIMCPSLLRDIELFKDHFEANYPSFEEKILRPAHRLNFYVQVLSNFQRYATFAEKNELRKAINHLEELKRNANTEMTIKSITNCPVDLHLGGKILNVGELTYVEGALPKKIYYLIAFENMLVITISKVSYLTYVAHYRTEQLVSVQGELEIGLITVIINNHGSSEVHKFKTTSGKALESWYYIIEEWLHENTASYEIISETLCNFNHKEGKLFPLSLWRVFPFLRNLYQTFSEPVLTLNSNRRDSTDEGLDQRSLKICSSIQNLAADLLDREIEYVAKLNGVFNPETLPPPLMLTEHLKQFLNLHELHFLPELQQAFKKNAHSVVDIFMNYLERFSAYRNYMVKRSLCTINLPDGVRAQHYVLPVQQFSYYIKWALELKKHERYMDAASFAVDTLMTCISEAKVMLLHEAIPNCCLDFYRTGELKRCESLELRVRPRQKGIRDGSYLVVLFEKVLLITRANAPTYNIVFDLWLNQVNFGTPSECSTVFKLEFRQGKSKLPIIYEFKTKNSLSKHGWIEALTEELQKLAEQIRKHTKCKLK